MMRLGELAPETRLMQLIDAEIFRAINGIVPTLPWEGTALDLEKRLTISTSDVSHQARALLGWQGAIGTYLGRLRKLYPNRFSHIRHHGQTPVWTILPL